MPARVAGEVRVSGIAVAALTLAIAAPAGATSLDPSGSVEVFAGGGYDSNLFLQVATDPDSTLYRAYGGGVLRLAPAGVAGISGDASRWELRAGADLWQTFGSGSLFLEDAQLAFVRPEVGPFDLRVGLTGGRFDATADEALRFWSSGAMLRLGWRLFDRWRFLATGDITARWYGDPGAVGIERDLAEDVTLRAVFVPRAATNAAVSVGYVNLRSSPDGGAAVALPAGHFTRGWAGLDASHAPAPGLALSASAWVGTLRADGGSADLQVGGAAALSLRLHEGLELLVRYEGLVDRRGAGSAGSSGFQRHVVTAGVMWRAGWSGGASPSREAAPAGAPVVAGTKVRFILRAPGASSVGVVGSWNDWATGLAAQRLRATTDPALWEGTLVLQPGTYRFRFEVDGQSLRPPAAARYLDDDFGGQDGVIEIGGTP